MKKTLICIGFCLCAGGLTATSAAWAKKDSNCKDADVVLSKKFPHFSFDSEQNGCARNDAGECDPDSPVIVDNDAGLVIEGTNRNNIIHGSRGPDTICGGNGKDEIWGEAGDDMIYGGNGKDSLFGGLGGDYLYGGNGKDDLSGYDDTFDGDAGFNDGEDDDYLYGENGKDELTGGPGDDFLDGGRGKDYLYGGYGDDEVNGDKGRDHLDGGYGDDEVYGGKGKDDCVDNDDNVDINECEATELEDNRRKNKSSS